MSIYTDFIRKLTDVFTKKDDSNVAKLVKLLSEQIDLVNEDFSKIEEWKSIDLAEGKTLDLIGENYGQRRGLATDEIMRVLIKARIARNSSDGTFDSIINALSRSIDADPSKIKIRGLASDITLPTWSNDFVGKVAGSTAENPHISRFTATATLMTPGTGTELGSGGTLYSRISALDSSYQGAGFNTNGVRGQMSFSFNLIAAVEKKVGGSIGATTADKVTWLKANVSKLTANWHGFGTSVITKASFKWWIPGSSLWSNGSSHSSGVVAKITLSDTNATPYIDSSGFFHALAHAEPADGVINSVINTDYINLEITLKPYNLNPVPASISIEGVPIQELNKVGMNATQFGYIAQRIVAAGVKVQTVEIKGTFSFSSVNNVVQTDPNAGFAPLDQSRGGRLGATFDPDEEIDLPI